METKRGRKGKYTEKCVTIICEALENGESDKTACRLANIEEQTYYRWLKEKSEFSERVKKAKEAFIEWTNNGILEEARKSLKTLIMGQEYEEVKTEYESDPSNPDAPRIKKQSRTTKKILPNPTAVIFALCNRDPDNWQNRITNELTGKVENETKTEVSLKNVPDELLAQVIDAINKK